jgi:hypothetical protein
MEKYLLEGGPTVHHTEAVQKLELVPNDIKLEGVANYLRFSRRDLLLLKMKVLDECVTSEDAEPTDKSSSKWKKWRATKSVILECMLTSLVLEFFCFSRGTHKGF